MKSIYSAIAALLLFSHLSVSADNGNSPDRNYTGFEAVDAKQPLWEYGVGGMAISTPNHPSSSEQNFVPLVLPYVIYRGDILRLGDGGARAVVVENNEFELDVSLGGAFAAEYDDSSVRAGMPELDHMFEIGPQLIYRLQNIEFRQGGKGRLNLRLQLRSVFSSDFGSIKSRGYVFQPMLSYQQRGVWREDTAMTLNFSLLFASQKLQDYFYSVTPEYATANRPVFDASGGYMGAKLAARFSFPLLDNVRGFAGGTIDFNQGVANQNSPLFEKEITYSFGAGFVWRIGKSKQMASW